MGVWRAHGTCRWHLSHCCFVETLFAVSFFHQAESFVKWWQSFRIWHEHLWAWRTSKIWSSQLCDKLAARVGRFHLLKRRCESFWQPCSLQEISGNSLGGMDQSAGPAARNSMACQFSTISDKHFQTARPKLYACIIFDILLNDPAQSRCLGTYAAAGQSHANFVYQDHESVLRTSSQDL